MRRTYFYIPESDHRAATRAVEAAGLSFSEFVRQALVEKLDRDQVIAQVVQARQELTNLVHDLRGEVGRLRTDLMDDQRRGTELLRQDAHASLKKNEELLKTFVLMLGGQGPAASASTPRKPNSPRPADDSAPMRVPG